MLKYVPLNIPLISNPVNWGIVLAMVALASAGFALVFVSNQSANDEE